MVALRRRQRSSASASMEVECDPTSVPGKPFLEHLHRVLDTSGDEGPGLRSFQLASTRKLLALQQEARRKRPLVLEASCLCYLQQLFRAMLTPTASPHSGLVTQWRLSSSFAHQLEESADSAVNMGAASPEKILLLAGRLLEVDTLCVTNTALDVTLPTPSDCDLAMLPKLSRLQLDSVDPDTVRGLDSVSQILTEFRFSNKPIRSLGTLLVTGHTEAKWRNLRSLCVDGCLLSDVDSIGISCVPNVETVVFTNNELEDLGALPQCDWLSVIDVSHNRIHSLTFSPGVFEHVKVLNLSHNLVSSIRSLHHLQHLEVLDLSFNLIHNLDEIHALAPLGRLHSLFLKGNPVSTLTNYRSSIRKLLSEEVLLDNTPWEAQDLEDFAGPKLSTLSGLQHSPSSDFGDAAQDAIVAETPSFDKWWVARGVGSSGLVIGFAQLLVSMFWSRDSGAEQIALSIVAATAVLSVVSLLLTVTASWFYKQWSLRSKCSDVGDKVDVSSSTDKSSLLASEKMSALTPLQNVTRFISSDSVLNLDEFSAAVDDASRAGEDVTVDQLLSVCSHLQSCIAYWSRYDSGGVSFAWIRLDRAMSTFSHSACDVKCSDLLRDRLSSPMTLALDAARPSQSPATALAKLVPVVHLGAIVLTSLRFDESLQHCLRDAYSQVFMSRHTWWRQRAVLASIGPLPTTNSFLGWIHPTHDNRDLHRLLSTILKCGERLFLVHACLLDLVDEHEHSFVYPQ